MLDSIVPRPNGSKGPINLQKEVILLYKKSEEACLLVKIRVTKKKGMELLNYSYYSIY
jgi:hypothetical protein